jgi:hypothetical protein
MEARMTRWLTLVTLSIGAVSLWALPPSAVSVPEIRTIPEVARVQAIEAEMRRGQAALRAIRWSDSLSALVIQAAVDGVALSPPRGEAVDPEAARRWEDAQRTALAGRARRDPRMVVGFFWQRSDPVGRLTREVTFVGLRDGTPYCIEASPYTGRGAMLGWDDTRVGACQLYAAHGPPGGRIQEWLDASALGFVRIAVPTFAADFARAGLPPPDARLFGVGRPSLSYQSLTVQACLAGRAEACERAMTDPELIAPQVGADAWLVANTPASSFGGRQSDPPFGYLDDGLLYEWEAGFGPEAFSRFWTSSERVPEAFETAFGVPLGEWVLRWAEEHVGLYRAGPSLPAGSLLWSVLALAGLAGAATLTAARRRVG